MFLSVTMKRRKKKSNTLHLTGIKRKNGMSLLRRMTMWLNLKFIWHTKEWTTPDDKSSCHLVCVLDIIVGTLQIPWPVTFTKFLKLRFINLSFRILTWWLQAGVLSVCQHWKFKLREWSTGLGRQCADMKCFKVKGYNYFHDMKMSENNSVGVNLFKTLCQQNK